MLFRLFIVILLIASSALAELKNTDKILLIGDSLSYSLSIELRKYAKAEKISYAADPRGGTTLGQWVGNGWAKQNFKVHKPTIVLVSLGTNDAVNKNKFPERAKKLVELAHNYNAKLIWLMPPKMPFNRDFAYKAMEESGADGIFDSRCLDLKRTDGIHLTQEANKKWAQLIWNYLKTNQNPCTNFSTKN